MKKTWFSFCLAAAFVALWPQVPAFAQEGGAAPSGADEVSSDASGLVSFDFKDADIRNVLRIFSHKTGINIVASPDVQGSVTVKLNNVPWEKALKVILEMHDFAYVKEGNVIKVLTKAKVAQEPLKTEVIALDYAKAKDVITTIQSMLTERGSIKSDERANLLIITDVPSSFDPIMNVLKRLDAPTPQVLIESKLIETTLDVERNFGIKWSFLNNFNLSILGPNKLNTLDRKLNYKTEGTDAVNHSWGFAARPIFDTRNQAFQTIDVNGDGIADTGGYLTQGTPFNYNHQGQWQVSNFGGITPASTTFDDAGNVVSTTAASGTEIPFIQDNSQASAHTFTDDKKYQIDQVSGYSTTNINMVMSALMEDDGTDILSAPSITTLDNVEASIEVAQDFPVPVMVFNEKTDSFRAGDFKIIPIGITLSVTPHVAPNGYVSLILHPKVGNRAGEVRTEQGNTYPIVNKEEIKTTVMVKDGDTIILGGLLKQSDTYSGQKVPLLHSIPVLGWLFKNKDKTISKRNLLIFVTPTIIKKENITTITQDRADFYTKTREGFDETTTLYPKLSVE